MGRLFAVSGENLTLGTGNVLVAGKTAADGVTAAGIILLRRFVISQSGSTTSAQIRFEVFTRDTAGTLTLSTVTPRNLSTVGGPASGLSGNTAPAGGNARIGINSSADSGGTYTQIWPGNFNNLNGELDLFADREPFLIPSAIVFGIRFLATPGTSTGWTFVLEYEEVV